MDIAEIGFAANSDDIKRANDELKRLVPTTDKAERATDRLNDEWDRGSKSASKFQSVVNGAMKGLAGIGSVIAGGFLGGILAGGIENALSAAWNGLKGVVDQVEHFGNVAAAAGGSVGGVQILSLAMNAAGVEAGETETAIKKLNTVLGDIAIGNGPGAKLAKAALDELGISAAYLRTLDVDQRFVVIAGALDKLNLSASQSAALLDNLGIKSTNMIAALSNGGGDIAAVRDQIDKLGLALTSVDQKNLADLDGAFDQLGVTGEAAGTKIAAIFAPFVAEAIDKVNAFVATTIKELTAVYNLGVAINDLGNDLAFGLVKPTGGTEDQVIEQMRLKFELSKIEDQLATSAANARNSMGSQLDVMSSLDPAISGATGSLDSLLLTYDTFGDNVDGSIPTLESLSSAFDKIDVSADKAGTSVPKVSATLKEMNRIAKEAFETADKVRQEVVGYVGDALNGFFSDLRKGVPVIDALTNALGNLADSLMSMVMNKAITGILGGLLGGAFGGLGNDIGPGASWGGLQSFLGQAKGGAWNAGTQMFAKGGVVGTPTMFGHAGGLGMMGEAGPEAIMPLRRGPGGELGVAANSNYGATGMVFNVTINNNAANDVEASATMDDDGSLTVTIDKIMAKNVADPGSKTNGALRRSTGARNSVMGR